MEHDATFEELERMIKICSVVIAYTPRSDELDWRTLPLPSLHTKHCVLVPQNKDTDPFALGVQYVEEFRNFQACILIPGTAFDRFGTRHGRGSGWYDKFLSQLPRTWIRVGITDNAHMSKTPLVRHSWDEPVDWILIFDTDTNTWNIRRVP